MSLTIIDAATVRRLLPMADCMAVMREAMIAVSRGAVVIPPRIVAALPDGSGYFATMPGSSQSPAIDGAKLLTLLPANPAAGRPAIQGLVLLFDHASGTPMAVIDGAEITTLRTAAASGLATRLLARCDARSHGVLGTGVQAAAHIEAIAAARATVVEVLVWGRSLARAQSFAAEQGQRQGLTIRAVADAAEACACDIVSAVTGATQPVLQGAWLRPGAHVNLVGAHQATHREADTAAITRSAVYVDLLRSAMTEAGDLLIPMQEGAFMRDRIVGEIGQLVAGEIGGRSDGQQITLYKSLGIVAQDLYAAWAVLGRARGEGLGTTVDF